MIKTKIKGSFSVKVIRHGKVISELPRQSNLILSGAMSSIQSFGTYIHVGTGSAAPVYADTSLQVFLASASNGSAWVQSASVLNGNTYEKEASKTVTFSLGAVVGNLTELGLASQPATNLQTRALFKDILGDPTTITVTALDQLVITYFVSKHITMTPSTSSVSLGGDTIDYTIRPCISSTGDGGSFASVPSSVYTSGALYLTANDANRISVDPITFIPTSLDVGGDQGPASTEVITLTATGNTIVYTVTMPTTQANYQWQAATIASGPNNSVDFILYQIEFNGPNYIVKNNTETVTFKIIETVDQVV